MSKTKRAPLHQLKLNLFDEIDFIYVNNIVVNDYEIVSFIQDYETRF